MLKAALSFFLGLSLLGACEKKDEAPPSPKQASEVGAAEADHAKAVADKAKADQAVETAKTKQDMAEDRVDSTKDKAKDTASNVADNRKDKDTASGWKGPDKGWGHDWATFAAATDPSTDKGDYTIEREKDGSIAAYRKTQPVAGGTDSEMKDSALAAQVKTRLAQDSDDALHAIDVTAKDHVVELRGSVKDTDIAGSAVRIALGTPGADKVISKITWASK
jgi:osmotically-inducible protein OsmY